MVNVGQGVCNSIPDAAKQSEDWEGRGEGDRGMVVPLLMKNKPPEGYETDERLNVELRPNEVSHQMKSENRSFLDYETSVDLWSDIIAMGYPFPHIGRLFLIFSYSKEFAIPHK